MRSALLPLAWCCLAAVVITAHAAAAADAGAAAPSASSPAAPKPAVAAAPSASSPAAPKPAATPAKAAATTPTPTTLTAAEFAAAEAKDDTEATANAAALCKTNKPPTCGWASDYEEAKTAHAPFAGTVWRGFYGPLPQVLDQRGKSYFQYAGKLVSLGCRPLGRLVVRTVFKTLPGSDGCVRLLGDSVANATGVSRCELVLPLHGSSSADEVAAALRSKEVNCKPCRTCADCPQPRVNNWYSDTMYFPFEGCAQVAKATAAARYAPTIPAILLNPGALALIAKFEVQPAA